jgi:hypothetical protein
MKLGKNKRQLHKGSKIKKITIKRMMIKIEIKKLDDKRKKEKLL